MSTRSKVLFVVAALLFAGAIVCGYLWRDQQRHADAALLGGGVSRELQLSSSKRFEKNAGEWRMLALIGGALGALAIVGGARGSRRARRVS